MVVRRYSVFFSLFLLLCSVACLFSFLAASKKEVTVERCERLGFPVLLIETDKNKPVNRKDKYVKASYVLGEFSGRCKIRGRGNSTWKTTFTQKKPYLLKLDEPRGLAGFPAARKWVLMANAAERINRKLAEINEINGHDGTETKDVKKTGESKTAG